MASSPVPLPPPQRGQPCPCGSGKLFEACCGPLFAGERAATTAEELMRSRFTAHVAHDYRYLHRTYKGTKDQPFVADEEGEPIGWTRLVVHAHEPGPRPDVAFVEFSAFFVDHEQEQALQERAEFVRTNGQWIYTRATRSGPPPVKSTAPKVGRNDPCPCGSGKKYKHCCLGKA